MRRRFLSEAGFGQKKPAFGRRSRHFWPKKPALLARTRRLFWPKVPWNIVLFGQKSQAPFGRKVTKKRPFLVTFGQKSRLHLAKSRLPLAKYGPTGLIPVYSRVFPVFPCVPPAYSRLLKSNKETPKVQHPGSRSRDPGTRDPGNQGNWKKPAFGQKRSRLWPKEALFTYSPAEGRTNQVVLDSPDPPRSRIRRRGSRIRRHHVAGSVPSVDGSGDFGQIQAALDGRSRIRRRRSRIRLRDAGSGSSVAGSGCSAPPT